MLAAILAASIWGFVVNTRIALRLQAELAPGMEHPYDYQATGCLLVALLVLMLYYLTRAERIQPRIWRRVGSSHDWAAARRSHPQAKRILLGLRPRGRRKGRQRFPMRSPVPRRLPRGY